MAKLSNRFWNVGAGKLPKVLDGIEVKPGQLLPCLKNCLVDS